MFFKKEEVDFEEVDEFDDRTHRGGGGFGSTGLQPVYLFVLAEKKWLKIRILTK